MAGVEYQVTKVDPTDPETKGMVYQVHKVSEEVAATLGGKVYRARIIKDPSDPAVAGKVYQIVLIGDPDDPAVKGKVYNAILTGGSEAVVVGPAVSPLALDDAIADTMEYVKAYGGTEQRNLPAGYTQLEYIGSTGTQYIDTGVLGTDVTAFELKGTIAANGGQNTQFIGGTNQSATSFFGSRAMSSTITWYCMTAQGSSIGNPSHVCVITSTIESASSQPGTLYDTETGTTTEYAKFASATWGFGEENILLFGGSETRRSPNATCYYLKLYTANGLVFYGIPAKNSSNVVGLYDVVSGTFFTNGGTGDFIAGTTAVPTPDAPIDIVSNNGVLKVSRNLFNVSANPLEQGGIASNDGQNTANSYYQRVRTNGYIPVKPNTVYTASVKDLQIYYLEYAQDKTYTDRHASGFTNNSVTFTTGANTYFVRLQFRKSDNTNIMPSEVTNVQLEQGSTATDYMPHGQIYTDGTVETINVHGKNLFDKDQTPYQSGNYISSATVGQTGFSVTTNANYNVYRIEVQPNTTYTFGKIKANAPYWVVADSSDEVLQTAQNGGGTAGVDITITTVTSAKYLYLTVGVNGTYKCDDILQLERGSTATDYVPYYNGGTATAEMLLKVGNYQDEQEILSGSVTRSIEVKVFDGTENWGASSTYQGSCWLNMPTTSRSGICVCSHFANVPSTATYAKYKVLNEGIAVNLWYGDTKATAVANLKAFLAQQYANGTPVILLRALTASTTESVAGQTLQVTDGDNVLEITQASLDGLELEAEYEKEAD